MLKPNLRTMLGVFAMSCCAPLVCAETTVDDVLNQSRAAISDGQASQQKVANAATSTRDLVDDYRQVSKITEDLAVYNKKLEIQVAKQQEQIARIDKSMGNVHEIQGRMLPLAIKMIDSLERFIELDLPFLLKERQERIKTLRSSMDRPEISVAEKFRQVLEAYKIENEYGRHIKTYQSPIVIEGQERQVNMLQVGRIALIYQTTDGSRTGAWNKTNKQWEEISSGKYRGSVQQAIRIAKKQASIDILSLPISAPEVFQP